MKSIINRVLPLKGFKAMTLYCFLLLRKESVPAMGLKDYRHEYIHYCQQVEVMLASLVIINVCIGIFNISWWWCLLSLVIPFVIYLLEWIVRLIIDWQSAYRKISFEQEAYANENDTTYYLNRTPFAWVKYLVKK